MSELINARNGGQEFRRQLLITVSALALLSVIYGVSESEAADQDTDRPTVWIELGGQLEQQSSQGDIYVPPFIANDPASPAFKPASPIQSEKAPLFSNGGNGTITFEPSDSNWIFSAAVLYGRANGHKDVQNRGPEQQQHIQLVSGRGGVPYLLPPITNTPSRIDFSDTEADHRQSHMILDFQAGTDVGLGMFGTRTTSTFSAGVRIAQFVSNSSSEIHATPDLKFYKHHVLNYQSYFPSVYLHNYKSAFHVYGAHSNSERSFHGVGPMLSWNGSTPLVGQPTSMEFTFDWGANAALLFGRQRASGQHRETGHFKSRYYLNKTHGNNKSYYTHTASFSRQKSVIVPNAGGFAGVSFKFPNAKISLGYRGDFFFGAMDTGIDTRKTEAVGFYGPFASISVGFP